LHGRVVDRISVGTAASEIAAHFGSVWESGLDGVIRRIEERTGRVVEKIVIRFSDKRDRRDGTDIRNAGCKVPTWSDPRIKSLSGTRSQGFAGVHATGQAGCANPGELS
jgi:ribosomal protein L14